MIRNRLFQICYYRESDLKKNTPVKATGTSISQGLIDLLRFEVKPLGSIGAASGDCCNISSLLASSLRGESWLTPFNLCPQF